MTNVDYELVIYDELPPPASRGGGKSILNGQLETIKENPQAHGKPVRIGLYSQGSAATAAKNVLQQRFGRSAAVDGWKFYTRPVMQSEAATAETLRGLFAVFTPEAIVSGAKEAHEASEQERILKLRAAHAERQRAAAEAAEEEDWDDEDEEDEEDGVSVG